MKEHRRALILCASLVLITLAWEFLLLSASGNNSQEKGSAGGKITLHATGQGTPWVHLRDGQDLPTDAAGPAAAVQDGAQSQAQPLALASADLDEDGVADLISAYRGAHGGLLSLHRGNVDAIYPNSPEARHRKASGE